MTDTNIFSQSRQRQNGCYVCGKPTEIAVTVQAREMEGGRAKGRSVTQSRNFCRSHGETMYIKLSEIQSKRMR